MEFYSLPFYNQKPLISNKNSVINPNQLRNYNLNSNIEVSLSPIKSHNYNKNKNNNYKDNFNFIKKNQDYDNDNFTDYKIYGNNNNLVNKSYKNFSVDYDNRSVNLNNNIKSENYMFRNNNSYSNVFIENKNIKRHNNFFDYTNNNNNNYNNLIYKNNNINLIFNNQLNNTKKEDFWIHYNKPNIYNNTNYSNFMIKNRSTSFYDDKIRNNNLIQNDMNNSNKYFYKNNYKLNDDNSYINNNINNNGVNDKFNNRSLSSYKSLNHKNFKYLFDYSDNNNINNINNNTNNYFYKDLNDNSNNNLSLHDRYISPDYIDELKSKNFYKDNKSSQLLFKSLNEFESYFNNKSNNNNPQIKTLKNNPNSNLNINRNLNSNFYNINKNNLNKNDPNYRTNILNYILNNSEIFKKIIDNALINNNSNIINNINKSHLIKNNNINDIEFNFYLPKKTKENINKKTLLLDLDETLVHSSFKPLTTNSDINFNIFFQNKPHMINVLTRPYVQEFLEKMSKLYELVIFTASVPQYANPLLDKLDKNKYIIYRLYRQHCISLYGLFIKDLRRIGRDLKNTIILDNNPISYLVNQDNGLPIKTWHSDKNDKELIKIIPLLEYLAKNEISDIREVIKKVVVNNNIDYNLVNKIINNKNNFENTFIDNKNFSRVNSFKTSDKNNSAIININNNPKFFTPKKDRNNNVSFNNYYKNESYNKKDNNNININIINFNISKVYMNEDLNNNNSNNNSINSNKIKNNIPISKNAKKKLKNKIGYLKKIGDIFEPNKKESKEGIESIINSKYKYLGHLINNKKQHKSTKLINKEIENNKRNYSQKDIFSTTLKNRINSKNNLNNKNNKIIQSSFNSHNKRIEEKAYNNIINKYQNNEKVYDIPYRRTSNNINRESISILYNNFVNDDLSKNKNNEINNKVQFNNILKKYSSYNNDNNKISNNRNIYNKMHHRASTPSVINHHHLYQKNNNNRDIYKDYINYNNFKYIY